MLHRLEANQVGGNWQHGRFRLERLITLTTVRNKRRWLSHRDITAASARQANWLRSPHSSSPHHLSTAHVRSPVSRYRCEANCRLTVKLTVQWASRWRLHIINKTFNNSPQLPLPSPKRMRHWHHTDHTHTQSHAHTHAYTPIGSLELVVDARWFSFFIRSELQHNCSSDTNTILILTSYLASFPSYWWLLVKFWIARGECLTLTLSLGAIPCQYRHNWYIAKTIHSLAYISTAESIGVSSTTFT